MRPGVVPCLLLLYSGASMESFAGALDAPDTVTETLRPAANYANMYRWL